MHLLVICFVRHRLIFIFLPYLQVVRIFLLPFTLIGTFALLVHINRMLFSTLTVLGSILEAALCLGFLPVFIFQFFLLLELLLVVFQLFLDVLDVLFLLSIAPALASLTSAEPPWHPVLVHPAHFLVHRHVEAVYLSSVSAVVCDLCSPGLLVLYEGVAFGFLGFRASDDSQPIDVAVDLEEALELTLISLVVEMADEYGLVWVASDLLVIIWPVRVPDLRSLLLKMLH